MLKPNVMSHLGIKPGDQVELHLLPDRKVMIHAVLRTPFKALIGSLAGKTDKVATLNEINEAASKGGVMNTSAAENLALVRALAIYAFGSASVAESWLNQYHALLGAALIVAAESSSGFIEVQKILNAISYGGAV